MNGNTIEQLQLLVSIVGLLLSGSMELRRSKLRREYEQIKAIRNGQFSSILSQTGGALAASFNDQNQQVADLRDLMERQMGRQEWTNRLILAVFLVVMLEAVIALAPGMS